MTDFEDNYNDYLTARALVAIPPCLCLRHLVGNRYSTRRDYAKVVEQITSRSLKLEGNMSQTSDAQGFSQALSRLLEEWGVVILAEEDERLHVEARQPYVSFYKEGGDYEDGFYLCTQIAEVGPDDLENLGD